MQIYVCVKHVPDSAANIVISGENSIDKAVPFLINPYDEHAVTEAVNLKETVGNSEVVAVCFGSGDAERTLRTAMEMGADRSILITTEARHDSITTARVLKSAIENDGDPEIIFTGRESIDDAGMQTMFRIGKAFGFPVATNIVEFSVKDGKAIVESEREGGIRDVYELSLPCVLGAGRGLNTPLYPTFPQIVKARKKKIKKIGFKSLAIERPASEMEIIGLQSFVKERTPQEIKSDPDGAARQLAEILYKQARLI